ncbi:MAG: GAF domain-containing sensor histidine kinase [Gaiellales bacterium]
MDEPINPIPRAYVKTTLAVRLAEAGMAMARHTTPTACAVALVEQSGHLTSASHTAFVGAGRLSGVVAGRAPGYPTAEHAAVGEIVAEIDEWIGVHVQDLDGGAGWSGTLWLCDGDDLDTIYIAQVLARQAGVAFTTVLRGVELEQRARQHLALVEAGKSLSQERSHERLLLRIIELATDLVDARYGALGVVDPATGHTLQDFVTVGIDDETRALIGDSPKGLGLLGVLINDPTPLRMRRIADDPRSAGFPPNHPPMESFLGVPVRTHKETKGRIYLTEKQGAAEFSELDEELVTILASQAGIAIENATLNEELQETADELAEANSQLRQADVHKSTFLANVSHELRSPLNTILGYTRLLLEDGDLLNEDQREDLEIISTSGTHLLRLITDLLDMSRIEAGRVELYLEVVDIDDLVADVAAAVHPQAAERGIELLTDTPGDVHLTCDRLRLRQMLLNVATNAIKFTDEGSVTIGVEHHDMSVEFMVTDTGPGIEPQDLERIFESFYQSSAAQARTPRAREGAGLGLAITRMLAELHHGTVSISSRLEQGTTVTITLPTRTDLLDAPGEEPS